MSENIVVEADDPLRCQGMMSSGQCTMKALPGFDFCKLHNAASKRSQDRSDIRNLNVAVWQSRINKLADSPKAKSLREEIGVLRLLLEAILNSCREENELIAMSNRISDLVTRIEKVVNSCHQLEKSSGQLLDKSAALQLASSFIDVVAELCTDPDQVSSIADRTMQIVADANSITPSK